MLQSLIVNRLNQIIENAHPQGFADGIHMVVGGDENDTSFIIDIDGVTDQIEAFAIGQKVIQQNQLGLIETKHFFCAFQLIRNANDFELGKLFDGIHQNFRQHRFVFNDESCDAIHGVHLGSGGYKE